jgi:hypothetical protein
MRKRAKGLNRRGKRSRSEKVFREAPALSRRKMNLNALGGHKRLWRHVRSCSPSDVNSGCDPQPTKLPSKSRTAARP